MGLTRILSLAGALLAATLAQQTPAPLADARCPQATAALEKYGTLTEDAPVDEAVAAALRVSSEYDACAAFASARGNVDDLQYLQVRSARFHYAAAKFYFAAEDYPHVHEQLNVAFALVEGTLADRHSKSRAAALAVRNDANALFAKMPAPTGISTAPATRPASRATPSP